MRDGHIRKWFVGYTKYSVSKNSTEDESAPIQLAQCWFPGLAISNVKILKYIFFQIKYTEALSSNSTRKLLWFWNYQNADRSLRKKYCVIYYNFRHIFVPYFCRYCMRKQVWRGCVQNRITSAEVDDCSRPIAYSETTIAYVSWRQLSVMSSLGAFSLNMPRYLASNTISQNEIVSKWQASNVSHKIWSSVRECSLLRLLGPKRHNKCTGPYFPTMFYLFTIITSLDSVAEWLACWTHAHKGPGSNRSRDAVG